MQNRKLGKLLWPSAMPSGQCLLKQIPVRCKMQAAASTAAIIQFAAVGKLIDDVIHCWCQHAGDQEAALELEACWPQVHYVVPYMVFVALITLPSL